MSLGVVLNQRNIISKAFISKEKAVIIFLESMSEKISQSQSHENIIRGVYKFLGWLLDRSSNRIIEGICAVIIKWWQIQ